MKITDIKTYLLKVPLGDQRFYSSQCAFPERNSLLVRIETDTGICGWGESGQYGPGEPVATFIETVLKPRLIGKNPLDINVLWEDMFTGIRDFGRKTTGIEAMSGIDIALWDIAGKFYNKPVYELLGGAFRKKVLGYATGCYYRGEDVLDYKKSLQNLKDEASGYIDAGFTALKIKVGLLHVKEEMERIAAIREAVGDDIILMVDANHAYNFHTAKRIGKFLEEMNVHFFEEPVVPENIHGYKTLRETLNLAIAAGENEFTRFGYLELLKNECLDIIQPNIGCAGGFTEAKRIEALASAYHVQVIPHCWGSGIALAAALQYCATIAPSPHTAFECAPENSPMIEYDKNVNPLRDSLLTETFSVNDGFVHIPDGPGLGVEINMSVLEKYLTKS
ncbi:mandelate racemase/muconate lactonizing enzyme family protein [Pontiella sulfatireligans]|uniref:D-galactarolactone cycloisomerase n=1 Tax=Pontiella sulfatireligans TaxID=2750658 RepID=A0A6C2UJX5_9BACT|nr:mandelate racemase/muconate lactonizing enzyme family protein [Pontiella sulfatireligans]VGO19496.1 D-galactarolactone cycloisomerase [Pontiella sulfatireligans]